MRENMNQGVRYLQQDNEGYEQGYIIGRVGTCAPRSMHRELSGYMV